MSSDLFSLKLISDCSKLESLCDISVTRMGDTLHYGFLQTDWNLSAVVCFLVFNLSKCGLGRHLHDKCFKIWLEISLVHLCHVYICFIK